MNNLDKIIEQHYQNYMVLANWRLTCSIQQQINKTLLENNNQENDEVLRLKKLIEELN